MSRAARSETAPAAFRLDIGEHASRVTAPVSDAGLVFDWLPVAAVDPAQWADLCARAIAPSVFYDPAFARPAANYLSRGVGAVTVRRGAKLVALWPGRIEGIAHGRPCATFVGWTHPFAPYSLPLIDRERPAEVLAALLDHLPMLPGHPRLALLSLLDEEGPAGRLVHEHLQRAGRTWWRFGAHQRAAFARADATEPGSANSRKEWRRQRRRLEDLGALSRDTVTDAGSIGAAAADYLAVEASGWKGRAGGAALLDPATSRFVLEAVGGLAAKRSARIEFLRLDGQPIAAAIMLVAGDHAWLWKIAYDEQYARYSPGVQLALELTQELRTGPWARVDSCATAGHPMIDRLWQQRLAIADWLIPLGGGASLACGIATEAARRAVITAAKKLRPSPQA